MALSAQHLGITTGVVSLGRRRATQYLAWVGVTVMCLSGAVPPAIAATPRSLTVVAMRSGAVASKAAGIACPGKCSATVPARTRAAQAATGSSSLATTQAALTSGQVAAWAWGYNPYGNLGDGTAVSTYTPVQIDLPTTVHLSAISAGQYTALGLDSTGNAWAWGLNSSGQLGNPAASGLVPAPVSMPPSVKFTAISEGYAVSAAIDNRGDAWVWGRNDQGALGNGSLGGSASVPTAVTMPTGVRFTAIAAAYFNVMYALDTQGHLWEWGGAANAPGGGFLVPTAVTMPAGLTLVAITPYLGLDS